MTDFQYELGNETTTVRIEKSSAGYAVTINGQTHEVSLVAPMRPSGELALTIDGARHTALVAANGPQRWVAFDSQPFVLTVPQATKKAWHGRKGGHDSLEAQMPGLVRQVLVAEGDSVEQGQVLLVLEAMKMEMRVSAPHAGVVEKISVREGETVGRGQALVELAG